MGHTVFLLVSVGQARTWQASSKKLREYVGENVSLDLNEIADETIANYIRRNLNG